MNWISLLGLEAFVARWRAAVIEGAIAAEDRLELVHLEWNDQKRRLRQILVLTVAVGGLTVVALILLSLALMVQFWDSPDRTMVAWLIAGTWLLAWAGALIALLSIARQAGNAFGLTRRELNKDWRHIKEQL
ncbi:MAG: phage holin family protein [Simplicispira sp.]|nr:phage holin family protein [Simplicispira sp.]